MFVWLINLTPIAGLIVGNGKVIVRCTSKL